METVLITGGTGMIGKALSKALVANGYAVIILTRGQKQGSGPISYATWDPAAKTIDAKAIETADHIIHLAGANVGKGRWTASRKKEILESRVKSGELLVHALSTIPNHVRTVVSASATGWYGPDPTIPNFLPFKETDPPAHDFLGDTCQQWEASIAPVVKLGKRLAILRTGIVLSNDGGAYPEFKKTLAVGVATVLGPGNQYVSWIHIDDLVALYIHVLKNEQLSGIYNAVAPRPVTNKELVFTIARQKRSHFIPVNVPEFALKAVLGEMSIEVLKSVTASAASILGTGFLFAYPVIDTAVSALEA
jgi:hypothetical protein